MHKAAAKRGRSASTVTACKKDKEEEKKKSIPENAVIWIKASDGIPRWEKVKLEEVDPGADEEDRAMFMGQIALRELNRLVGGFAESPPFECLYNKTAPAKRDGRRLQFYCNEDGRISDLSENKFAEKHGEALISGDVVVCVSAPGGRSICFSKKDLALLPAELVPAD